MSITHGNPLQYIWSYAAGLSDDYAVNDSSNCPCTANPGHGPNSFIGPHYCCESGPYTPPGDPSVSLYYLSDPLWDGVDCPTGSTCCDNPNLSWFYRELDMATIDDIEVGLCTNDTFSDEQVLVDQLELYIQ